ncbi:MAG: hypothetical protein LBP26_01170 [Clostridiales bacterium]|jgi:RNA polymerase primary sigma factor|nr:hypothetical protein [Clostridiales bacterium]
MLMHKRPAAVGKVSAQKPLTAEQIKYLQAINSMQPISLSTPVGDAADGAETGDFIASPEPAPDEVALKKINREYLEKFLCRLDPRGGVCVRKYYGLADGVPHTLEQIGKEYGVTRERVRQVILKSMRRLTVLMRNGGVTEEDFLL